MILRKAFQFKLRPDGASCRKLARFCGCARFVYNKGLAWNQEERAKDPNFRISYAKLCALLPQWKKESETAWHKGSGASLHEFFRRPCVLPEISQKVS